MLSAGVALLAGCSSTSVGVVSGTVHAYGGPASTNGSSYYTGQPVPGQEVVVEDEHRDRTTVTSDARGHYSVSLPPGTYTLMCGAMPKFTIAGGQTAKVDCDLQIP